jgi:hypothetical protein
MKGHGNKFTRKQEAAIAALLSHRSIEQSAHAINVAPNTLLRWLKEPDFKRAYREARLASFGQAVARMQQASGAAVSSVLRIMVDTNAPASTRLRAADIILDRTLKSIELEEIEARITELERASKLRRQIKGHCWSLRLWRVPSK